MKNVNVKMFAFLCLITFAVSLSSYTAKTSEKSFGIEFTIKNDTEGNVRLYDGKGYFTMNRGTIKKVDVEVGRKYYNGEGGKKGKMLFEVSADMKGKTIKLSDYM